MGALHGRRWSESSASLDEFQRHLRYLFGQLGLGVGHAVVGCDPLYILLKVDGGKNGWVIQRCGWQGLSDGSLGVTSHKQPHSDKEVQG